MNYYPFIIAGFVVLYLGYYLYMRSKRKQEAEVISNTDFKHEMASANLYRDQLLKSELSYLQKEMGAEPIDAFNYANTEYTAKDAVKDGVKDQLKGMATLGTVKFRTVQTPKYLVLSGDVLHLFDTDTDGEIDTHLVFKQERLQNAILQELPLEGQVKAFAAAKGSNVKAYKLSLPTDDKPVELLIFSCLIFTNIPDQSFNPKRTMQQIVVANDFLRQLGDKYANLKVELPVFN